MTTNDSTQQANIENKAKTLPIVWTTLLMVAILVLLGYVLITSTIQDLATDTHDASYDPLVAQSTPISNTVQEEIIHNSETYRFEWDGQSSIATLFENGIELSSFEIGEKPLNVWIYKPTGMLAIVTSQTGNPTDAHSLWLYKAEKLTQLFIGATEPLFEGITNNSHFSEIQFSPDGRYLSTVELVYEGQYPMIFSTATHEQIPMTGETPFGNFRWSPQGNSVLSVNETGMYGPSIFAGQISAAEQLEIVDLPIPAAADELMNGRVEISWNDNAMSGIIRIVSDDQRQSFLSFGLIAGTVEVLDDPKFQDRFQATSADYQENIYFIQDEVQAAE
jgi:hypothetical protein